MLIRPPRNSYPDDSKLNNSVHLIEGKKYVKKIFTITNDSGNKLCCSMWEPEVRPSEKMPVVIYMHGNAGCKLEGEAYAAKILKGGMNLFAFDFSGCGNSEGEWVTLGWKEQHDLKAVVTYLQALGTVSKIGVWGRSMGAAASIFYISNHPDTINVAILDSSFASLNDLVNNIAVS